MGESSNQRVVTVPLPKMEKVAAIGHSHGGIIATVLDEAMSKVQGRESLGHKHISVARSSTKKAKSSPARAWPLHRHRPHNMFGKFAER